MISNDFKKGITIMFKDQIHEVLEYRHVKPGKGGAFVRTKMKNLESGRIYENTFRATEKIEQVITETKKMQYLFSQNDELVMMDLETYDQIPLGKSLVDNKVEFLKEGSEVMVKWGDNKPLSITMPTTVELKVTVCDPGVAGDTVQGGTKPVTLETGAVILVPLFIENGETLKVDTRTGEYIERSN